VKRITGPSSTGRSKAHTERPSRAVTVFGSGRCRAGSAGYREAYETGRLLAQAGFTVVNGGYGGTMEAGACGARDAGGRTVGVIARYFSSRANPAIERTVLVGTHGERLLRLIELGDAYIVLKGGTGTLDELITVWEYVNKGILKERPIVLIGGFWRKIIDSVVAGLPGEGLAKAAHSLDIVPTPRAAVRILLRRLKKT
jgi:uncharacterized protein (TIGR00730 family)